MRYIGSRFILLTLHIFLALAI